MASMSTTATTTCQATDAPTFSLILSPNSPSRQEKPLDFVDTEPGDLSRSSSSSSWKSDSSLESGNATDVTDSGSATSLDEVAIKAATSLDEVAIKANMAKGPPSSLDLTKALPSCLDLEKELPSPALSIASSGNSEYFDASWSPFAIIPTSEITLQDVLDDSPLDMSQDADEDRAVPTVVRARRRFSLMSASSVEEQEKVDSTPRFAAHQGIDTLPVYKDEHTRPSTSQGLSRSFFRKSTLIKKVSSSVSLAAFSSRKHGRSVSIDDTIRPTTLTRSESTFTLSGRLQGMFTTAPPVPTNSSSIPSASVQETPSETRPTLSPFQRIRRSFSISEKKRRAVPYTSTIDEPLPPQVVPPLPALDIPISSKVISSTAPQDIIKTSPTSTPQNIPPPRTHSLKHLSIHTHGFSARIQQDDLMHGDSMPPSPKPHHLTPRLSPLYQSPTASSSTTSLLQPRSDKQQNRLSSFVPPQRKESLVATIPWRKSASPEQVAARRRTVHDDMTLPPSHIKDASKYDLFELAMKGTKQSDPVARSLQVRKFIARETCLTEKSYLHQLVILHDQYYLTLLNSVTLQSKNLLPVSSLAGMFEHLPMLITVSKEISDALSLCWVNPRPRDIARAFLDRLEMIETVFVNYARGYAKGFEMIRRARRSRRRGWERWMREAREQGEIESFVRATSPTISAAISELVVPATKAIVAPLSPLLGSGVTPSADAALRRLTLEDLLVAPLQRIMRYVLLLKDLRKHTVLSDTMSDTICEIDVEAMRSAHHAMERIALKCDKLQSEREEARVESSRVSIAIAI